MRVQYKQEQHKVTKGEDLSGIAKKYGHKSWKTIWEAPENKKVVQSRREPEKIAPGDVLVIPPNEKEKKEIQAQVAELYAQREGEIKLHQTLQRDITRLNEKHALLDNIIKTDKQMTQSIVNSLNEDIRGIKLVAGIQDGLATIIQIGIKLGKLVKTGYDHSKAAADQLEKLNKKGLEDARELRQEVLGEAGKKSFSSLKDSNSMPLAIMGIAWDSWDKMTSPSFWSHTYVQITQNGKTWSEAVQMEIGDDMKQQIKEITARSAQTVKKLNEQKKEIELRITENGRLIKETEKRIKQNEAEAAALPTF